MNMHLNQMNLTIITPLLKYENQAILRYLDRLAVLLGQMLVPNPINKNSCLCIDVHLVILHTQTEDQGDS